MEYIINRLCEESTWGGIYLSLAGIIVIFVEKYNLSERQIAYIIAIAAFIAGQILIWTRDFANTKNKIDDIGNAASRALLLKFGKKTDA